MDTHCNFCEFRRTFFLTQLFAFMFLRDTEGGKGKVVYPKWLKEIINERVKQPALTSHPPQPTNMDVIECEINIKKCRNEERIETDNEKLKQIQEEKEKWQQRLWRIKNPHE